MNISRRRITISPESQERARLDLIEALKQSQLILENGGNVSIAIATLEIELMKLKVKYFRAS